MNGEPLTFTRLREANLDREPGHGVDRGWTVLEWAGAMCGEAGELANICKKIRRGDKIESVKEKLGAEAADIIIYLDVLCAKEGIDLGEAVRTKFNQVAHKFGARQKL